MCLLRRYIVYILTPCMMGNDVFGVNCRPDGSVQEINIAMGILKYKNKWVYDGASIVPWKGRKVLHSVGCHMSRHPGTILLENGSEGGRCCCSRC